MKKKIARILIILIISLFIINCYSFADDSFSTYYKPVIDETNNGDFITSANKIIGVVSVAGSAIALITLIIIGIKYVVGSVEEKARYKETLKPYLIGCFMVFGIFAILGLAKTIAEGLFLGI